MLFCIGFAVLCHIHCMDIMPHSKLNFKPNCLSFRKVIQGDVKLACQKKEKEITFKQILFGLFSAGVFGFLAFLFCKSLCPLRGGGGGDSGSVGSCDD